MYIALKDLNLSGVRYMAGEKIPEEAVVPNRATALINSGYIAHEDNTSRDADDVDNEKYITIHLKKCGKDIILYRDEAEAVFVILQENAEEAAVTLAEQNSRNVLDVIRELDSRKGVKVAAEAFLKELNKSAEETAKEYKADVGQQKEAVG